MDTIGVTCPYCFEAVELWVDPHTVGEMVEDCAVCCQPWSVRVHVDRDGVPTVFVGTLDGE